MKETARVRVREAREPRKRYVQSKEEEEHRLVHQNSRRDPEVSEYSNLVEKRGASGLPTNYGSLLHRQRILAFQVAYHAIYVQRVCSGESFSARTIKCGDGEVAPILKYYLEV